MNSQSDQNRRSATDLIAGTLLVFASLAVVLSPEFDMRAAALLLACGIALNGARLAVRSHPVRVPSFRSLGVIEGSAAMGLAALTMVVPWLGLAVAVQVLAVGMVVQGVSGIMMMRWPDNAQRMKISAVTLGVPALFTTSSSALFPVTATPTAVILLLAALLVSGVASIASGIRDSTKGQKTLAKLITFAMVYGFTLINLIDLTAAPPAVPGYNIWLGFAYFAPFGALVVIWGRRYWKLAAGLGLLVSMVNDLAYHYTGNVFLGSGVNLVAWLYHQFGLAGSSLAYTFQGGLFTLQITSLDMGISVYLRGVVVLAILYHYWKGAGKRTFPEVGEQ